MEYISGVHALNLTCSLNTCGDWHQSAIQWERPTMRQSEDSIFGSYGIETGVRIPEHEETFAAANHIRALLDLLAEEKFSLAQGMRNDFICTDEYNEELFEKISAMKCLPAWQRIDAFMEKEYRMTWVRYKNRETESIPGIYLTPGMHPAKEYMRDIAEAGRHNAYGNFLDRFREARNNETRQYLITERPDQDDMYPIDAAKLAATVEILAKECGIAIPEWVMDEKYILKEPYYGGVKSPVYRKMLEYSSLPEFRRRNLFLGDNCMDRA